MSGPFLVGLHRLIWVGEYPHFEVSEEFDQITGLKNIMILDVKFMVINIFN